MVSFSLMKSNQLHPRLIHDPLIVQSKNFFILVVAELKVLVVSEEADFLMLFKLHIPHELAHIQQIKDEMSTSGHLGHCSCASKVKNHGCRSQSMCEVRRLALWSCHVDLSCERLRNIIWNLFLSLNLKETGKVVHGKEG